jgi:hypothetical protein
VAAPIIQFKRGVLADLPALRAGEPGFTTDAYDLYVGVNSTTGLNQFVGSGRYWSVNTATVGSGVKLVEGTNNGTHSITVKAPNSLAGDLTYTMPGTDGSNGQYLQTNGSGELSFSTVDSSFTLAADSGSNDTFTTGETLTFTGTSNEIVTTVSNNTITFSQPTDVTIGNDLTVTNNIAVTGTVDGRDIADDGAAIDNLVTTTGVAKDSTHLGTFTGSTISDNGTIKAVLQEVETSLETVTGGNAASATVAIAATTTNASHFLTFVDANNASKTQEAIHTDAGISYNPSTNTLTATNIAGALTGNVTGDVTGTADKADQVSVIKNETAGSYYFTFVDSNNTSAAYESLYTDTALNLNPNTNIVSGGGMDMVAYFINSVEITSTATELNFLDGTTAGSAVASKALAVDASRDIDNLNVVTATTIDTTNATIDSLTITSGTAITSIDTDITSVSGSDDTLASAKAIKTYVDAQLTAEDLDIAGDSGTGAVDLDSQSLTIAGTANEVETSASGQTVTVGLPAAVVVTTSLDVPTVEATNLKAKDGTTSITITDSTGAVACAHNLTVGGNLIVNGSTTQVNTTNTTVDDALFEIGTISGSAPSSDLNKDIGLVMHYFASSAKKAAVYWDDSAGRIILSKDITESANVLTNNAGAEIEVGGLHITGCSGTQEIISCSSGEVVITNATIDGGSF